MSALIAHAQTKTHFATMTNGMLNIPDKKAKPATKKQQQFERHFITAAKGRPKKEFPMNKTKQAVIDATKKKSSNPACHNWNLPENFPALKATTIAHLKREGRNANDDNTCICFDIQRSTLQRHVNKFQSASAAPSLPPDQLTWEMTFLSARGGGKKLLDDNKIELLSSAIIYGDESSNGMAQIEAIALIMELCTRPLQGHLWTHSVSFSH